MAVEMIVPESWSDFVKRLRFVGSKPLRWSWVSISRGGRWAPYCMTIRASDEEQSSIDIRSDKVWGRTAAVAPTVVQMLLQRKVVADDVEVLSFEPQGSYSAFWLPPGVAYGAGRTSGWPEYYTTWPLHDTQDLRYQVQWHTPFRAGGYQFKTLMEAAYVLLFGQRYIGGPGNDVQPGI